jgi:hypothetical protein
MTADGVEFAAAPDTVIDFYADCAWPERFTREEMELRRKECRTINEWDSQYQLHSKPVGDVRLDPDRIREYNIQPQIRYANRTASCGWVTCKLLVLSPGGMWPQAKLRLTLQRSL